MMVVKWVECWSTGFQQNMLRETAREIGQISRLKLDPSGGTVVTATAGGGNDRCSIIESRGRGWQQLSHTLITPLRIYGELQHQSHIRKKELCWRNDSLYFESYIHWIVAFIPPVSALRNHGLFFSFSNLQNRAGYHQPSKPNRPPRKSSKIIKSQQIENSMSRRSNQTHTHTHTHKITWGVPYDYYQSIVKHNRWLSPAGFWDGCQIPPPGGGRERNDKFCSWNL